MTRFLSALLSVVFFVSAFASASTAQVPLPSTGGGSEETGAELPDPLTPEAIQALVARMSDEEVRDMLLDQLQLVAEDGTSAQQGQGFIGELGGIITRLGLDIADAVQKIPLLISGQSKSIANFVENYGGIGGVLQLFGLIVLALAVGLAAMAAVGFVHNWAGYWPYPG